MAAIVDNHGQRFGVWALFAVAQIVVTATAAGVFFLLVVGVELAPAAVALTAVSVAGCSWVAVVQRLRQARAAAR